MRICICDDMISDLRILKTLCEEYLQKRRIDAEVICTKDAELPLREAFVLLILVIEMPGISGIDVKNALIGCDRPLIIFVTSYVENMKDAFGPNVMAFMQKPVESEDFAFYMDQALRLLMAGKIILLERGRAVSTEKIVMITTDEKYIKAVFFDGTKTGLMKKSLSVWEKELADVFFIRVNSSCLLNCKYIETFEGDQVILKNGVKIKASKRQKTACRERFLDYIRRYVKLA